jgi:hypothetical protein
MKCSGAAGAPVPDTVTSRHKRLSYGCYVALQGGAINARDVPRLVITDSNFTRNGRLPRQQPPPAAAAAAAAVEAQEEDEAGPSRTKWAGALGVAWRDSESTRDVTLTNCR